VKLTTYLRLMCFRMSRATSCLHGMAFNYSQGSLYCLPYGNFWLGSWYGVACVAHTCYNIQGVILLVVFV